MPSSEDIAAAHTEVQEWHIKYLQEKHPDWPISAVREVSAKTAHQDRRELFAKETGAWLGAYSPY